MRTLNLPGYKGYERMHKQWWYSGRQITQKQMDLVDICLEVIRMDSSIFLGGIFKKIHSLSKM